MFKDTDNAETNLGYDDAGHLIALMKSEAD